MILDEESADVIRIVNTSEESIRRVGIVDPDLRYDES
jgi:hypothetical protein